MGQEVTEQIYEKHQFFTAQLIEAGVDPVQAEKDACRIEHVISDESFQKLKEAYQRRRRWNREFEMISPYKTNRSSEI